MLFENENEKIFASLGSNSLPANLILATTPVAKPSPYCPSGGWTSWYNNDSPAGNGDDETLRSIRSRYPGDVCDYPTEFEARVSGTKVGLDSSSDNVIASRLNGLECLNGRGRNCKDYEIRFCCPRRECLHRQRDIKSN